MFKRLRIHGTVLRARPAEEKAAATDAFIRDVVPLLETGTVAPVIARTFTLDDADAAYDLLAADAVFGKIVLDLALTRQPVEGWASADPDRDARRIAAASTTNGRLSSRLITHCTVSSTSSSRCTTCRWLNASQRSRRLPR